GTLVLQGEALKLLLQSTSDWWVGVAGDLFVDDDLVRSGAVGDSNVGVLLEREVDREITTC
ncbi:Hypothetical protein FKW44_012984, partial [Caligus rogercresseyi]